MSSLLSPARRLLASSWLAPLNDRAAIDRLLQRVAPLASVNQVRARIESITPDGRDGAIIWLRANRHWQGHRAGQHVLLTAEINGVRQQRAFSLSNGHSYDGRLRLTLRRSARGLVSAWLQQPSALGKVVELSQARGEFLLPEQVPSKLLMVAGGSGISPIAAMLENLAARGYAGDILLLRAERQAQDRMSVESIAALADQLPGLRRVEHYSAHGQRLDRAAIAAHVPDAAERAWFVCGPEGLQSLLQQMHGALNVAQPFRCERFAAPRALPVANGSTADHWVSPADGGTPFAAASGTPLLQAAEAAGLSPSFGCRAGICRTCLCQKRHGTVRNLMTGMQSDAPDEWIQLCISSAESDLELAMDRAQPAAPNDQSTRTAQ